MATGAYAARPGGFAVKTAAQTLLPRQKRQVARNLGAAVDIYTADGAILVDTAIAVLAKTSAAAMTLAAPTAGTDDGIRIQLVAGTAFAHVVTATGLIDDGVTGGAKNTVTLGAFVGASCELMAYNGHWVVLNLKVATIA